MVSPFIPSNFLSGLALKGKYTGAGLARGQSTRKGNSHAPPVSCNYATIEDFKWACAGPLLGSGELGTYDIKGRLYLIAIAGKDELHKSSFQ